MIVSVDQVLQNSYFLVPKGDGGGKYQFQRLTFSIPIACQVFFQVCWGEEQGKNISPNHMENKICLPFHLILIFLFKPQIITKAELASMFILHSAEGTKNIYTICQVHAFRFFLHPDKRWPKGY